MNKQLVHLGDYGQGVNKQRVHLGNGQGVNLGEYGIVAWMNQLAERLRYVRVCCGDWARVVTDGALSHGTIKGIFLDPPYSNAVRESGLYTHDNGDVAQEVRDWCLENGKRKDYRIVLAGYDNESNQPLLDAGWKVINWKQGAAYQSANSAKTSGGNAENRYKEVLLYSPNCIGGQLMLI